MTDASTIFALSSAPGKAGVAVIRVSGSSVSKVLEKMVAPRPKPRSVVYRTIRHPRTAEALDRAVVLWFAAPKSETGEDVAEFQVHGSRAVVAAILSALGEIDGCRLAEPGEFARRAFENGKLDLAEIEGLADLIEAETDAQRRQALAQAGGSLSKLYENWRSRLIEIAALTEAAIDFSDEGDVSTSAFAEARNRAVILKDEIAAHLNDGHRGEILRDGFRVALLGPPNAGKSSLLNALARRDAAIVSAEAGTTRDVIEVRLDLGGLPVIVSDTAGIREASSEIEREGIRRSLAAARDADLVIWLAENPESIPPLRISRETSLVIRSKADLPHESEFDGLAIAATTGAGMDRLIEEIARRASQAVGSQSAPALTQARHRQALENALKDIEAFLNGSPDAVELRAEDLRRAAHAIGRIRGRIDVEDVLNQIFSRFCIGK
jgi:tRNA modification GTPase